MHTHTRLLLVPPLGSLNLTFCRNLSPYLSCSRTYSRSKKRFSESPTIEKYWWSFSVGHVNSIYHRMPIKVKYFTGGNNYSIVACLPTKEYSRRVMWVYRTCDSDHHSSEHTKNMICMIQMVNKTNGSGRQTVNLEYNRKSDIFLLSARSFSASIQCGYLWLRNTNSLRVCVPTE